MPFQIIGKEINKIGFYDAKIIEASMFGIAPKNARIEAISTADFVTHSKSGEGAVLDASIEIVRKFF